MKRFLILLILPLFLVLAQSCTKTVPPPLVEISYEDDETTLMYESRGYEIPFEVRGGVRYVKVKVNGVEMEMVFDTGASGVSLSLTEARFLYKQGTLTDDDILGYTQSRIADGSIVEDMVVNLKEIELTDGLVIENVKALVTNNFKAPLLLGNSALRELGSFTIDDENGVIIFQE